jgi:hypothetical protein
LVEGYDSSFGGVGICTENKWAYICGNSRWTDYDAKVVCRMLGYKSGHGIIMMFICYHACSSFNIAATILATNVIDFDHDDYIMIDYVTCQGSEDELSKCQYDFVSKCYTVPYIAGVVCSTEG